MKWWAIFFIGAIAGELIWFFIFQVGSAELFQQIIYSPAVPFTNIYMALSTEYTFENYKMGNVLGFGFGYGLLALALWWISQKVRNRYWPSAPDQPKPAN